MTSNFERHKFLMKVSDYYKDLQWEDKVKVLKGEKELDIEEYTPCMSYQEENEKFKHYSAATSVSPPAYESPEDEYMIRCDFPLDHNDILSNVQILVAEDDRAIENAVNYEMAKGLLRHARKEGFDIKGYKGSYAFGKTDETRFVKWYPWRSD